MTREEFDHYNRALGKRIIGFNSAVELPNGDSYNDGRIYASKAVLRGYIVSVTGHEPRQMFLHTYETLLENMFIYNWCWLLDLESADRFRKALDADLRYQPGILFIDTVHGTEIGPEWDSEIGPSSDLRPRIQSAVVGYTIVDSADEIVIENGKPWLFGLRDECHSFHVGRGLDFRVREVLFPEYLRMNSVGIEFEMDAIADDRARVLMCQLELLEMIEEEEEREASE